MMRALGCTFEDAMGALAGTWTAFCGESDYSHNDEKACGLGFLAVFDSFSCINHFLVILVDMMLLLMLFFHLIHITGSRATQMPRHYQGIPPLQIFSALFNGSLGLVYLILGIWMLEEKPRTGQATLHVHQWLAMLFQGLTWVLLSLTVIRGLGQFQKAFLRRLMTIACMFGGFLCASSLWVVVTEREISAKTVLDVLSLPGAILLVVCAVKISKRLNIGEISNEALYEPLSGGTNGDKTDSGSCVTSFSNAGLLSRMSFWWLNSLMKMGSERTLEEKDVPELREVDRAESCYSLFVEELGKQKQDEQSSPSVLWTIVSCQSREILVTGFFAFLKTVTLSTGPLLLNAFIKVAEGEGGLEYEAYLLAGGLFFVKCIESVSQRQWFFRTRLIGVQVRSLLSAAIYRKQLRLSNAAKLTHSAGEIMNYVTVDTYRIGEFPFWFHHIWTTSLQLCFAIAILFHVVGLATFSALVVIVLTVLVNAPLAKLQHKYQTKLMGAQDERLKATTEALVNMKVLKLYAWETHFKGVIEGLRKVEYKWLKAFQLRRAYNTFFFWGSPVLVSAATFGSCYLLGVPLYPSNVFTFVATLRLVQDPIRAIPDLIGIVIQAKVAYTRIVKFLEAPELQNGHFREKFNRELKHSIEIKSANFSWEGNYLKPTLKNINLVVRPGEKVAICGEVGSGKSTLLAAILGEVPNTDGKILVRGKVAYVSQAAWIQTGSIRENILFGCPMDKERYQEVLEKCSLVKDFEMLPFGDLTEIGERGVNLSGGQKQRIQLARAVYQVADIYLLDDPFSAVDAQTASTLYKECIIGALSGKTVLLVTHQVDFLPGFDSVLLMSDGAITCAAPYPELLASSREFQDLVNAHKETAGSERLTKVVPPIRHEKSMTQIQKAFSEKQQNTVKSSVGEQLIQKEETETGDTGLKPYLQYLNQNKGYLYYSLAALTHLIFVGGQVLQNSWMAANVQNPQVSKLRLIIVYIAIGGGSTIFLFVRSLLIVVLGMQTSKSLFSQLLNSLFHAPMAFFDSTPLGRILSRVSSDLSILDLDLPFSFVLATGATVNLYSNLGVLAVVTWQILFMSIPMLYLSIRLQSYYFASAKEFMRINGTTKSLIANHLGESISGAMTIRAFKEEHRFFAKNLDLIDKNASPFFHNFAANEWLIQRLETMGSVVLCSSALVMALLPPGTFSSGFIGMALSYGLSLNLGLVWYFQNQCTVANHIISVERLNQYMYIPSEAPEVLEGNRPTPTWPTIGKVEFQNLKIRYRPDTQLVLRGISCTFEGGQKIGIVGRTGSGKTTLIGALFRLVEPADGKIIIDDVDISTIGLHDLRSRLGIIPQDPTLFQGTVRFNLDPLEQHTDAEIWEVLGKCQLREAVQDKEEGLDSLVVQDGSNWSMGQRQLFCLGRALLRRSRILVLDEATASIDNATDLILQKTIRTEFAECTVITVAHRIPTVMDCTKVLALSDGKIVEYDEPMRLMKQEGSLFAELVIEYWSHSANASIHYAS